jgi:outer membrane protein insertion porin family
VPAYQLITPGGDMQVIGNFEYRIPIIPNVVTLAPFADFGINKILLRNQLKLESTYVTGLNQQFPQADFESRVRIVPGTQTPRASLGMELQVMLPIVQAPFRIYWAYNPTVLRQYLQPPIVVDRSSFPNYATYANAVTSYGVGQPTPWFEKRSTFRFTIGKTF